MSYYDTLVALQKQADKVRTAKIDYMKQVLLMASALLGALLALYKKPDTDSDTAHMLFASAAALLSAGILLLSVGLYQEADNQARLLQKWKEQARIHADTGKEPSTIASSPKKIYLLAEKCGYVSFSLSMVVFVVYLFV